MADQEEKQERHGSRERVFRRPGRCAFCKEKWSPDYKNAALLRRFTTDRGRIVGRGRTGVCSRHQRALSRAIKRARELALLPFDAHI
ncbi:MAG: 30S ribosomal protein S18 [bacterium]|nr:30S ribosomal protein S18 [bacterium]